MLWFLMFACSDLNGKSIEETTNTVDDIDGDGFYGDSDCDETNPNNYEGAIEICDGVDNNCDGQIDEGVQSIFYGDGDGDGFGTENIIVESCSVPEGFVVTSGDCNDGDASVFPGASEDCDELDNDCDGQVDEGFENAFFADFDGDGFGNPLISSSSCEEESYFVGNSLDCDDQNASINPDAEEFCDEVDNNCDGAVDNNPIDPQIFYYDQDSDGYGTEENMMHACGPDVGYVSEMGDCDDQNPLVHPFNIELCNDIDENCNGLIDEGAQETFFLDSDEDGYGDLDSFVEACTAPSNYVGNAQDCDDTRADVSPVALEYCDGVDNDCDAITDENDAVDATVWYADVDQDGFGDAAVPFQACTAPQGFGTTIGDCDDGRPNVNPNASESCLTTYDDNCDGNDNDENASGCLTYFLDVDYDGYGEETSLCLCQPANDYTSLSDQDCDDTRPAVNPSVMENCNTSYDDDCDGVADEIGASNCSYFYYDYDGDDFGTLDRLCLCAADGYYTGTQGDDCDDLNGMINPNATEVCDVDDIDENCDGIADMEDAVGAIEYFLDADEDGFGGGTSKVQCDTPIGYIELDGDCDDSLDSVNPNAVETCFTSDDDDCSGSNNDVGAVGCVDFFLDTDQDGYGSISDAQCLCQAEIPYSAVTTGDCDDNNVDISPGKMETCDSADDEDCDGVADEDGSLNCLYFYYDFDGDDYGLGNDSRCICSDDGYYRAPIGGDCDDMDISINSGQGNCGLMGNIPLSDAALTITGRQEDRSADTIQFVGDFDYNNDGIPDIAVVDSGYDTQYTDAGAVFLYLGPVETSIDVSTGMGADLIFTTEYASAEVGFYGLSVGNIDSDPFDEIIVTGRNRTYVINDNLHGLGTVTDSHPSVTLMTDLNTSSGYGVLNNTTVIVGDINHDGHPDFVRDRGKICFGDGQGSCSLGTNIGTQHVTRSNIGADTDGDGLLEWWGVSKSSLGSSNATLVKKEYDTQTGSFTTGNFTSAPTHVIEKGDVNGDGLDDVVGSFDHYEYYDTYQGIINGAGGIWAFYGDSQGVDSNPSWEAYGEDSSVKLGTNIDILDVDGDDIDDVLASGWAGGFLFYGALHSYTDSNGNPRDPRSSDAEAVIEFGNTLYRGVQNAGDQNQDGFDDFLIGGNYQKTEIYLFFGGEN